ncbi:nucleotidyltransferase family protein [Prevotella sp. P6B1]|uniref:nucleotidyltransferase domain-containing protein n=1 Tax=Prevotella sp. P6B1 TaxID=1410613 RepID=UPI0018CC1C81|nr:nucleotidyltransferase family protein [Prevotella sp. P6B1]
MQVKAELQFFELLRSGLWGNEADASSFTKDVDWGVIYQYADEQSVSAVVFDGIEALKDKDGKNITPPKIDLLTWMGEVFIIENNNHVLNENLKTLESYFHDKGIRTLLLKGQGCASLYRNPLHRNSGDIDLFVGLDQYEAVKNILKEDGIAIEKETRKDLHFMWHDTPVECHKMALHYYSPIINQPLQRINRAEEWREPRSFILEGQEIGQPNPTYNAFFIFMHIHHHFVQTGIGLRQICDWTLFLHRHCAEIDWDKIQQYLKDVRATLAWVSFYGFAKEYLALDINAPEWMRQYKKEDVQFLFSDIMAVGNFGQSSESMKHRSFDKGFFGNIYSFWALFKRLIKVFKYGKEKIIAYPIWKVKAKLRFVPF